jgi:hypothetical protein
VVEEGAFLFNLKLREILFPLGLEELEHIKRNFLGAIFLKVF